MRQAEVRVPSVPSAGRSAVGGTPRSDLAAGGRIRHRDYDRAICCCPSWGASGRSLHAILGQKVSFFLARGDLCVDDNMRV